MWVCLFGWARLSSSVFFRGSKDLETESKRLLRTSENVPADEGATEFQKCFVNVGPTFEANAKATEVVKPRMSRFDDPAEFSQTTAVFCPALGHHRLDAVRIPGERDQ